MITKDIEVNGTSFHLILTDQMINQVNNLKNLYTAAYEDPESFEEVSSEISSTINEIATAVEPQASDSDQDGVIQVIIKEVDTQAAEVEKQLKDITKPKNKPSKSKKSKSKSKK